MTTTIVSVLPLTTTFSQSNCHYSNTGIWTTVDELSSELAGDLTAWYTWYGITDGENAQCYPTGFNEISYYSPGICPDGYFLASTEEATAGTVTETYGTCCFDDYTIAVTYPDLYDDSWPCVLNPPDKSEYSGEWDLYYTVAHAVSVRWISTDFTTTPTVATSTTAPSTHVSTGQKPSRTSELAESGLSNGGKAGVGVGVSCGALIILAGILWVFYLRRKRNQNPESYDVMGSNPESKSLTHESDTHELQGSGFKAGGISHGSQIHEMPGSTWDAPNSSTGNVYELSSISDNLSRK